MTPSALWVGPFPAANNGIDEYYRKITSAMGSDVEVATSRMLFSNIPRDYPLQVAKVVADLARFSRLKPRPVLHIQHCPFSTGPGSLVAAAEGKALGYRVVVTVHEERRVVTEKMRRHLWKTYPYLEEALLRLADAIVVHSEGQAERLGPRFRAKARVIEFGIDSYPARSPVSEPAIGCFGLIAPYKGMDTVLEACAIAARRRPDLRLVIAGTLPRLPKYEAYFAELKARADAVMPGRVDLIADAENTTFEELYAGSKLVCFGLRHATQSTTFYKALAHGKPVVATEAGGVAEVLEREHLGRVVPIDDAAAMAAAIEALLDEDIYSEARTAVAAYAARRTWEVNAREHLALYDELRGAVALPVAA